MSQQKPLPNNTERFRQAYLGRVRYHRQLTRIAWMSIFRPDLNPADNNNPPAWANRLDGRTPITDDEVNWIEAFNPIAWKADQTKEAA